MTYVYKRNSVLNYICFPLVSSQYQIACVKPTVITYVDGAHLEIDNNNGYSAPLIRSFCWSLAEKTVVLFEGRSIEDLCEQKEEKYIKFDIEGDLESICIVNETCFVVTKSAVVYADSHFMSKMVLKRNVSASPVAST